MVRLAILLLAVIAAAPRPAGATPLGQPATPTRPAPAAPPPAAAPLVSARAAVVIDGATGRVLYQKNAHARLPPASLTKMATAMVALERGEPTQAIVATERSLAEPSVIGLDPGDRLPLREALYGLLLNSGNDVALAIAESIGDGKIPTFVAWMNTLVDTLGLDDTHFANPHGLDVGEHYSSAYDMAIIGRVMLREPLLRSIVAERRRDYVAPPLWAFRNINRFLLAYPGADGIKTGYESRAGRCLAASATRDGRQVISIVLNSDDYVADSAALMDYGFARLQSLAQPVQRATSRPAGGAVDRLIRLASDRTGVTGAERARLRSAARPDLHSLERDPTFLAGSTSPFERLGASRRGG